MKQIPSILIILVFIAATHTVALGQYTLAAAQNDSSGKESWQLLRTRTGPDMIVISLDSCEWKLGPEPAYVVSGERLYGCNLFSLPPSPGAFGPWRFTFAAYSIHEDKLRIIESCDLKVPSFRANEKRYEVSASGTTFRLSCSNFPHFKAIIDYDCAYFESGDGKRLYKAFGYMVKKLSGNHFPPRKLNYLDEI